MPTIDHDPHEPKIERGPGPWRWLIPAIGVLWIGNAYYSLIDWQSAALGGGTGIVLALWAIEVTGNKVPDWWRSKPPGSGRS
ncbi:hypothetical protein [Agrobacterium tumefaciens]|uniref:hypothetical protein n=1 Tax=Agrobacterium tumefaciens TaxID=358 RepID=UPI001FA94515|nr:hypothetical protein [Agrobacterium tumefaciens]UNZ49311.1 hypothetical protein MLE07_07890 [Agrobacterium tumefaciens]